MSHFFQCLIAYQFARRQMLLDYNQDLERVLLFSLSDFSEFRVRDHMCECTYTTSKDFLEAKVDNEINACFVLNEHGDQ